MSEDDPGIKRIDGDLTSAKNEPNRGLGVIGKASEMELQMEAGYSRFYDKDVLDQEQREAIAKIPSATSDLIREMNKLGGPYYTRWRREHQAYIAALRESADLRGMVAAMDESDRESGKTLMSEAYLKAIFIVGSELLAHDVLDRIRGIATQAGNLGEVKHNIDYLEYTQLGEIVTPLPTISIADIMDDKKAGKLLPHEALDFYMLSSLARRRVDLRLIFPENFRFSEEYPYTTMLNVDRGSFALNAGLALPPDSLNVGRDKTFINSQRKMIKYMERAVELRQKIYTTLLNPDASDYSALTTRFEYYLRNTPAERITALYKAGIHNPETIRDSYRKLRTLIRSGKNEAFNNLLGTTIKELVEEGSIVGTFAIPTQEDANTVVNSDLESIPPTFDELTATINTIFSQKRISEYDFPEDSLQWQGMVVPTTATIRFGATPHKLALELRWQNDVGEVLDIDAAIDTKKKTMDWNLLEASDDPELTNVRTVILNVTSEMLAKIQADVKAQRDLIAKAPDKTDTKAAGKREHYIDEAYAIRKQVKRDIKAGQMTKYQNAEAPVESQAGIKRSIVVPDEKEMQSFLSSLGSVDQEIIRKGITDFNERGIGKFSRKVTRLDDGTILYTLSVGCTVPKGARVLVHERQSSAGSRVFEILDIRYRKDIYRKAGI